MMVIIPAILAIAVACGILIFKVVLNSGMTPVNMAILLAIIGVVIVATELLILRKVTKQELNPAWCLSPVVILCIIGIILAVIL